MSQVHPTAVIHPSVKIPEGTQVGPFCVIGEGVVFEGPCVLRERVSLRGPATVGEGNTFFQGCVLGEDPQDMKFGGEQTKLKIGNKNVFREYVTVHRGTGTGGGLTTIGDSNLLMACSHVAHDCHIGNNIVIANYVGLSGHVTIEDYVVMGGQTGIIQFARIGKFAHVGGQMRITKDVVPFSRVAGDDRPRIIGVNVIGMERRGVPEEERQLLKSAFAVLKSPKHTTHEAVDQIERDFTGDHIRHLIDFIRQSKIGIHK